MYEDVSVKEPKKTVTRHLIHVHQWDNSHFQAKKAQYGVVPCRQNGMCEINPRHSPVHCTIIEIHHQNMKFAALEMLTQVAEHANTQTGKLR